MASTVGLSAGIKTSLYSLQDIQGQIDTTNTRLSTGKKVNSALDNALNYFLAQGFTTKANNFATVLDNINLGINTITQANAGLTSITSSLNQALGTLKSALSTQGTQSKATATVGFKDQYGNAVNASTANSVLVRDLSGLNSSALQTNDKLYVNLSTQSSTGALTVLGSGNFTIGAATTVQQLLDAFNKSGTFNITGNAATISASINDAGNLVIESELSGQASYTSTTAIYTLNIGVDTTGRTTAASGQLTTSIFNFSGGVGNTAVLSSSGAAYQYAAIASGATAQTTRLAAATTFRSVLQQISQSAGDAGYNGTNLLNGDFLTTYTNDTQSASIITQGSVINSTNLGLTTDIKSGAASFAGLQTYVGDSVRDFQSDTEIKNAITKLNNALSSVTQFATNLSTNSNLLQNRQVFTTSTVRNLTNGADSLTLADINQEGANLSSLQTKQQLAVQALSLANRSDQSILRLFG